MITIACALKSGGDFTALYVDRLGRALERNMSNKPFRFACFTDKVAPSNPSHIYLNSELEGWWSKLACFSLQGAVLYFDLDTILISEISGLIEAVEKCKHNEFLMLRPQRKTELWASGIMGWNGNHKYVLDTFVRTKDVQKYRWDQRYISEKLLINGVKIKAIQDYQPGIYSYKHHCKDGLPKDSCVIIFHGKPRPNEVKEIWVKRNWC